MSDRRRVSQPPGLLLEFATRRSPWNQGDVPWEFIGVAAESKAFDAVAHCEQAVISCELTASEQH
jgi:hypothetical protein